MATIQAYAPTCERADCHRRAMWEVFDLNNVPHGRFCREHAEQRYLGLDALEHEQRMREAVLAGEKWRRR